MEDIEQRGLPLYLRAYLNAKLGVVNSIPEELYKEVPNDLKECIDCIAEGKAVPDPSILASYPIYFKEEIVEEVEEHGSTKCEAPVASPVGGTYDSEQAVTLSCATDGATIYYTTDGSEPTSESTEYTGAITVSSSTTIKAIAIKEDFDDSDVASFEYTIESSENKITIIVDDPSMLSNNQITYNWADNGVAEAILNAVADKENKDLTIDFKLGDAIKSLIKGTEMFTVSYGFTNLSTYTGNLTINYSDTEHSYNGLFNDGDNVYMANWENKQKFNKTYNITNVTNSAGDIITIVNDNLRMQKVINVTPDQSGEYHLYINDSSKVNNVNLEDIQELSSGDEFSFYIFVNGANSNADIYLHLPAVNTENLSEDTSYIIGTQSDDLGSWDELKVIDTDGTRLYYDQPSGACFSYYDNTWKWTAQ